MQLSAVVRTQGRLCQPLPPPAELRVCGKARDCSTPNARVPSACIELGVAGFPAWGSCSTRDREAQNARSQVRRRRPGGLAEAELYRRRKCGSARARWRRPGLPRSCRWLAAETRCKWFKRRTQEQGVLLLCHYLFGSLCTAVAESPVSHRPGAQLFIFRG